MLPLTLIFLVLGMSERAAVRLECPPVTLDIEGQHPKYGPRTWIQDHYLVSTSLAV
jgi:hypothetical protein